MRLIFMMCSGKSSSLSKGWAHESVTNTLWMINSQKKIPSLPLYKGANAERTIRKYRIKCLLRPMMFTIQTGPGWAKGCEAFTGSVLVCRQQKQDESRFSSMQAALLEHMFAQTNIHARHNLAIRRKRLDVKATRPRGGDGTGLWERGVREWESESVACPHKCGEGLIRTQAFY